LYFDPIATPLAQGVALRLRSQGIRCADTEWADEWIPAFAGMTMIRMEKAGEFYTPQHPSLR
jgi:hypothetical protein